MLIYFFFTIFQVGILKKSSLLDSLRPKSCPGVPACPPPPLSDYEGFEIETKTDNADNNKSKRIRFAGEEGSDEEDAAGNYFFKKHFWNTYAHRVL